MNCRVLFRNAIILLLLLLPLTGKAQNLTNLGREFYFGFMKNETMVTGTCTFGQTFTCAFGGYGSCPCPLVTVGQPFSDVFIYVYISATSNTTGQIEFFNGAPAIPFSVTANTTTRVQINTQTYLVRTDETVQQLGLRVVANDDVNVFALNTRDASTDAALVIPSKTLRGDYYVMAHAENPNSENRAAEFMIVGSEDNTDIQITLPPGVSTTTGKTGTWTINVDKGETYLVRSMRELTGTYVTSVTTGCKPFALFGGNEFTMLGNCGQARDHLYEQMFPTATWGTRYITLPYLTRNGDVIKVMPLEDNTQIKVNGAVVATLNRQQFYSTVRSTACIIEADKPIAVGQFARSNACDGVSKADPFFINLSSVEQLQITDATFDAFNIPGIDDQYINIYTTNGGVSTVRLNGGSISASFVPLAGTNFSYARIPVAKGYHRIQSDSGFVAFLYGFGAPESYGYAGGVVLNNLNLRIISKQNNMETTEVCAGIPVDFSSTSIATVNGYEWDWGDGTATTTLPTPQHTYQQAGTYYVKLNATMTGACNNDSTIRVIRVRDPRYTLKRIVNNSCNGHDSIDVQLNLFDFAPPISITIDGQATKPALDSNEFRGLSATLHTVQLTDRLGCTTDTTLDLRPHALSPLSVASAVARPVSCGGRVDGALLLPPPSGGTGRYQYTINGGTSWLPVNGFDPTNATDTTRLLNLAPGNYTLQWRDDSVQFCMTASQALTIEEPEPVTAQLQSTQPTCIGSGFGEIRVRNVQGGSRDYLFYLNGGTGATDSTFSNLGPDSYTIEVVDTEYPTCFYTIGSVDIVSPSTLAGTLTAQDATTCGAPWNGALLLSNLSGAANYQYSLDGGTNWLPSGGFAGTSHTITDMAPGTYSLLIRDLSGSGCPQGLGPVTIGPVLSGPLAVAPAVTRPISCGGNVDGALLLPPPTGGTGSYQYTLDGGTNWLPINGFVPASSTDTTRLLNLAAGNYTVQWRDENLQACLTPAEMLTIEVPESITAQLQTTQPDCIGSGFGEIRVRNVQGGSRNYLFYMNSGAPVSDSTFSNLGPGTYTFEVVDTDFPTCFYNIGSSDIISPSTLSGTLTAQDATACGAPWDGALELTGLSGATEYQYSLDGGTNWLPSGGFTTSDFTIVDMAPGTYSLLLRDMSGSGGCPLGLGPVTIGMPAKANAGKDSTLCVDNATQWLPSPTPAGGTWSSSTLSINTTTGEVLTATEGSHLLIYNAAGICPDSMTLTIQDLQVAHTTQPVTPATLTTPTQDLLQVDVVSNVAGTSFTYIWGDNTTTGPTPQATASHRYRTPGTYTLEIVAETAAGCTETVNAGTVLVLKADRILPPNVITPNEDGMNDIWTTLIPEAEQVQLRIFDRWGIEIFATNAVNTVSWEGRIQGGARVSTGTYFYALEYISEGKKTIRQGQITVVY